VSGGVNDGVVVLFREKFLGGASNGDTTLTLFLLAVHVEGESERALAKRLGLGLQLVHLSLGDASELKNEAPGGGGLAGVNVTADDNRNVSLSVGHFLDQKIF
jgi:hypothetical protein